MNNLLHRLVRLARLVALRLARILATRAADRTLRELLPAVFERLDRDLKKNIHAYPEQTDAETIIRRSIEAVVEKPATVEQVLAVATLFSPLKFAKHE